MDIGLSYIIDYIQLGKSCLCVLAIFLLLHTHDVQLSGIFAILFSVYPFICVVILHA